VLRPAIPDPTTAMRLFSIVIVAKSGVFLTGGEGLLGLMANPRVRGKKKRKE
jgi:hypothetical protein